VGNYTAAVSATSPGLIQSAPIQVKVVKYLVDLSYYQFSPVNLTVPKGSTVYFFNTDAPHIWCGETDSGDKTISFTSVVSTTSPTIHSFNLWSITLSQAGTYTYMDTEHTTSGTGTIVAD
jgi:plastocyanin